MNKLTDLDFCRAASSLGCEPAAIAAVAQQESLGSGFDDQDRPVVLFERHIFHRLTGGIYDRSHPGISSANPGGYGRSREQYGRFSEAFALNQDAAMKATSWGKFQILGQNFRICGFTSVGAFVDAMKESEGRQLDAFCAFCLGNGLDQYLTDHNWAAFANGYNGHGYRKNQYDTKIAAAYKALSRHDFGCSQDSTAEPTNQTPEITSLADDRTNDDPPSNTDPVTDPQDTATQTPAGVDSNAANLVTPQDDPSPSNLVAAESQPGFFARKWAWMQGKQTTIDQVGSFKNSINSLNPVSPSLSPISGQSWMSTILAKITGITSMIHGWYTNNPTEFIVGAALIIAGLAYLAIAKGHALDRFKAFWSYKAQVAVAQIAPPVVNT